MSAPGLELAAQFGAAGIIGLMWLSERRASASREKQLLELHERVREDRVKLRAVLDALQANTRALSSLEAGQKQAVRQLSLLAARVGRGCGGAARRAR